MVWGLNWATSSTQAPPPPVTPAEVPQLAAIIKADIIDYVGDPIKKTLNEPLRTLVYTTAMKIVGLFFALIFPFIGYTLVGISIGMIDRVILANLSEFSGKALKDFSPGDIFNMLLGRSTPASAAR